MMERVITGESQVRQDPGIVENASSTQQRHHQAAFNHLLHENIQLTNYYAQLGLTTMAEVVRPSFGLPMLPPGSELQNNPQQDRIWQLQHCQTMEFQPSIGTGDHASSYPVDIPCREC